MKISIAMSLLLTACAFDPPDQTADRRGVEDDACAAPASGASCSIDDDCPATEECEDGACQLHHACTEDAPAEGTTCTVDADCAGGEECDDGACKPHGGGGDDD